MFFINIWTRPNIPDHYMRGTLFTSEIERASRYASLDDAAAAKRKARQFYPGHYRSYDDGVQTVQVER